MPDEIPLSASLSSAREIVKRAEQRTRIADDQIRRADAVLRRLRTYIAKDYTTRTPKRDM